MSKLLGFKFFGGIALILTLSNQTAFVEEAQNSSNSATQKDPGSVEVRQDAKVRLGGVTIGAGYSHYSGPTYWGYPYEAGFYPYWGGFWPGIYATPSIYMPFYYPGYLNENARRSRLGEIRLKVEPRNASVFVDGAYAGSAENLKTFWLEPGAYDLKIEVSETSSFNRRIYVLSGKTLKVDVNLAPPPEGTH